MSIFDTQSRQTDRASWLGIDGLQALHPEAVVMEWLTYEGLLTPRLRRHNAMPVVLEVLKEAPVTENNPGTDWFREVALSAGGQRLIYAMSWFPAQVIAHNPWLRTLADRPLGDALSDAAQVSRSEFEFTSVTPGQTRYERAVQGSDLRPAALWARRSRFQLEGGSVLVEEVFLPHVYEGRPCHG